MHYSRFRLNQSYPADQQLSGLQLPGLQPPSEYQAWLADLRPRTCLVVHWLADLGVVTEPGRAVRRRAHRFAAKHTLLNLVAHQAHEESFLRINGLFDVGVLDHEDLHLYATWLMWLRFQEYVPRRFVLPGGRDKVLQWVRTRLRRPELTLSETLAELQWHAERISAEWEEEFMPLI